MGLLIFPSLGVAEIYKYKDSKGRWQFSDAPKKGEGQTVSRSYSNTSSSGDISNNLVELLNSKYQAQNPVQKATLAVVTVKSNMGSGSGFL